MAGRMYDLGIELTTVRLIVHTTEITTLRLRSMVT
jgi:hypothetical protein